MCGGVCRRYREDESSPELDVSWFGYDSPQMSEHYTHVGSEALKKAASVAGCDHMMWLPQSAILRL